MELYKYCACRHMDALLKQGSVRLGTLFDYRDTPKYGERTGDLLEGITKTNANIIFYDYRFVQQIEIDSTVRVEGEGDKKLRHFKIDAFKSPDMFVFSAATEYSEDAHRRWLEHSGYDACYIIRSARLFLRAISRHTEFSTVADFQCAAPVRYHRKDETNIEVKGTFHPALLKSAEAFGDQSEFRAVWRPRNPPPPTHFDIAESDARRYCAEYRVL